MDLLPSSATLGPILIALLTGGFLRDLAKGILQRRQIKAQGSKTEAESTTIIVKTATDLLGPLSRRIEELESDNGKLRVQLRESNTRLNTAERRIETLEAELARK